MRMVKCKDCGRRYDYNQDDFCPKCGAYNPPVEDPATTLEQELLSRFDGPRAAQQESPPPRQTSAQAKQPPQGARTVNYHPTYGGTPDVRARQHAQRVQGCAACEEPVRSGGGKVVVAVVLILLVCIIGAVAVVSVPALLSGDSFTVFFNRATPETAPPPDASPALSVHALEELFPVNGVEVSIDDFWWVDLSSDARSAKEGYDCLAVDVWITGGTRQDELFIDTPSILLDGVEYPLDDDMFLSKRLQAFGVYDVSLRDYQWEDPLSGQFVFFLPQGAAGEATLLIREYYPGSTDDPVLKAVHHVPLAL